MLKLYRCPHCGQIVEIVDATGSPLVCCGHPMEQLIAGSSDGAYEKHVPHVTSTDGKHLDIQIGEVLHPATEAHHIEWIYVVTNLRVIRYNLEKTEEPKRRFELALKLGEKAVAVYEYCNLHGLYVKEL